MDAKVVTETEHRQERVEVESKIFAPYIVLKKVFVCQCCNRLYHYPSQKYGIALITSASLFSHLGCSQLYTRGKAAACCTVLFGLRLLRCRTQIPDWVSCR